MPRPDSTRTDRALRLLAGLVLLSAACTRPKTPPEAPGAVSAKPGAYTVKLLELPSSRWTGLSGLTRDGNGQLWGVPERQRVMLPIAIDDHKAVLSGDPVPLEGIPKGMDTESITWLAKNRFAFGTERQKARARDAILLVERGPSGARVESKIPVAYAPWAITARVNKGLEGACHAGGVILVASETVAQEGSTRFGPVARYDLTTRRMSHYRIPLTSKTGKLAGMDCQSNGDSIRVLAIERHFGVSQLVRFDLPATHNQGVTTVPATVLFNLVPHIDARTNVEGVVWLPDGRILLLCDNNSGGVTGPTQALILEPSSHKSSNEGM